jgi:protein TonB
MFDLITDESERPLRERSPMSKVVAMVGHAVILVIVVVIPLLSATNVLPPLPSMMAFVAAAPVPPAPPPPPPPAAQQAKATPAQPVKTAGEFAAPIEAPSEIRPEPVRQITGLEGVEGGVEGGVPGGVVGGIVGGLVAPAPPPPPPPPPLAPHAPVRIGGQITAPALVHRVEPIYPDLARVAQLSGFVILEATVNTDGCVESVKLLRSRHKLLDEASIEALKQWRYSPLVLNGIATPFVLTVTFTFSVGK